MSQAITLPPERRICVIDIDDCQKAASVAEIGATTWAKVWQ
jgi:hypothetical protein